MHKKLISLDIIRILRDLIIRIIIINTIVWVIIFIAITDKGVKQKD